MKAKCLTNKLTILYTVDVQSSKANLIAVQAAAAILKVSPQAVRDFIKAGELPGAFKVSDAANAPYLIPMAEVQSLAALRNKTKAQ